MFTPIKNKKKGMGFSGQSFALASIGTRIETLLGKLETALALPDSAGKIEALTFTKSK